MSQRHSVILLLCLAVLVAGTGFRNRATDHIYRVGILITDDTYLMPAQGFKDGLKELGYLEGEHIQFDLQNAKLDRPLLRHFAEKFVRDRVDLIFTATYIGAQAAKEATTANPIPVLFGPAGDPVELGLVKSIVASGNNLTGVSTLSLELTAKRLEMLAKIVPGIRRVALLYNPKDTFSQEVVANARKAADKLKLTLTDVVGMNPEEIRSALQRLKPGEAEAVFAIPDILVNNQVEPLARIAREKKLPYMVHIRSLAEKGALASYGINTYQIGRQAARLADKIFNGAKPTEIPIETPRKLELIINLGTAREIGLTVPQAVLVQADQILR